MIKNSEKYRSQIIVLGTEIILMILSLLYNFLFLLTNKIEPLSYIWSDLLYDFAEFFYNLTSSIFVQVLIFLILIYFSYKILKSRGKKFQKSIALVSIFFSFVLTYQKGKDIVELKTVGYIIINNIEEYYIQNDSLPSDLINLYPKNYSRDSMAYIIENFSYQPFQSLRIKDYRLFIISPIISPTIYLYSERKKIFVNFD